MTDEQLKRLMLLLAYLSGKTVDESVELVKKATTVNLAALGL